MISCRKYIQQNTAQATKFNNQEPKKKKTKRSFYKEENPDQWICLQALQCVIRHSLSSWFGQVTGAGNSCGNQLTTPAQVHESQSCWRK